MVDPSSDPLVGQQVANFRIDELVKGGSLSRIYHGRDVIQRRPVAVKVIEAQPGQDRLYLERFLREARGMMSAWWHQHITRVYYAAKRDGRYITVMEYVDGPDLGELSADYAQEGALIPVDDVIRIGRALAEALGYAHQHGVIHRDVKPSNVLMCLDGRILLTDFGLAPPILLEDKQPLYGTPHYISPEQISAPDELDGRADLYSLAAMLYELLVGNPPFQGENNEAVVQQHLTAVPPMPSTVNPHLSREVDGVLLQALAKNPEARYQDGVAFMDALEEALGASMEMLTEEGEMPPLPAVIQEAGGTVPAVSPMSVVDKIASQLEMAEDVPGVGEQAGRRRAQIGCWVSLLFIVMVIGFGVYYAWPFVAGVTAAPTAVVEITSTEIVSGVTAVPIPTIISATVIVLVTMPPPTPTATLPPTSTPPPLPTSTATSPPPTATSLPSPTPAFTGAPVHFQYNDYSFYMMNAAAEPLQVGSIGFQALDVEGQPTGQDFRGRDWSIIYPDLESGRCNAIELMDAPSWLRPPECQAYNVTLTPPITYDAFWLTDADVHAFRVFWNGRDLGTCPVMTGVCELHLP